MCNSWGHKCDPDSIGKSLETRNLLVSEFLGLMESWSKKRKHLRQRV